MKQGNAPNGHVHLAGYLVGFGFLALAAVMLTVSPMIQIPIKPPVQVSLDDLKTGAFRENLTDPPTVRIGTLMQRCNDCHTLFQNVRETDRQLTQHTEIVLNHGLNDGCLNCHDRGDREKLAIRGGEPVGYDQSEQLCAQCHGPIYRDWENGAHGKTVGFWDASSGAPEKLTCTQCHDPHSPAFEPMEPLPGPRTLRMGDPGASHAAETIDKNTPLQMWHLRPADAGGDTPAGETHEEGAHE